MNIASALHKTKLDYCFYYRRSPAKNPERSNSQLVTGESTCERAPGIPASSVLLLTVCLLISFHLDFCCSTALRIGLLLCLSQIKTQFQVPCIYPHSSHTLIHRHMHLFPSSNLKYSPTIKACLSCSHKLFSWILQLCIYF